MTASIASAVKLDLIFEISILSYPGIYVHIAFKTILVAFEVIAASK